MLGRASATGRKGESRKQRRARFAALVSFLVACVPGFSQAPAPTLTPQRSAPSAAVANHSPDLIFLNAVIYTGEGFSGDKPQTVAAMAISGGRVLAVGGNNEIRRLAGPKTRIRDLNSAQTGVFIFPGFNDAHVHLGTAGSHFMNIDLTGVRSLDEMLSKVQAFARNAPAGHWLTGGNWDHMLWPDKKLPTRQDLDQATGGHPAFLSRIDGHIAIANSAALAAAGITGKTAAPQGGAIDLDASGEPTGILRERRSNWPRE